MKQAPRQQLGKYGEDLAASFLRKKGYRILERNFRKHYREIDIVALKDQTLVFIEVKTRTGNAYGTPEEAVTAWKRREVVKTGEFYTMLHPELPEAMRIDVIAIELGADYALKHFNHIQNITM